MELENKPPLTPLAQQRLNSWSFKFSLRSKGILYIICGIAFIVMGALIISASDSVIEHKKRYDDISDCHVKKNTNCYVDFDIKDHMHGDVFVYYSIENMYQNHRNYGKSLSVQQLQGKDLSKNEIEKSCDPVMEMKDIDRDYPANLNKDSVANPCGLIAKSYFNDTYELVLIDQQKIIKINENDIAFDKDKEDKFKNSSDVNAKRWIDVKNEHLIVWFGNAATPTFRKLWGKINGLDKGKYRMNIESLYDVSDFSGKKSVILTTHSALGGKMSFLGILAVIIGSTSLIGSSLFFIEDYYRKKINL